jgi:hypothetical protein
MAGKQPDFHLYLSDREVPEGREKKRYYKIGAAWWNRSGEGMMITLNPGMRLDNDLLKEFALGMFKNGDRKALQSSHRKGPNNANGDPEGNDERPPIFDDDIPF